MRSCLACATGKESENGVGRVWSCMKRLFFPEEKRRDVVMVRSVWCQGSLILLLAVQLGLPHMGVGWAKDLPQEIIGKDGAPMVLIPAGPFPMGVPKGARDGGVDERPNHVVELDAFYIDKYEVTNGRYLEFIRATGHRPPKHPTDPTKNLWHDGLMPESIAPLPVVNVDWFDAKAYCEWAGKRLPTEAEWEKAAKGTEDRRFPWGDVEPTDKHLNFNQVWRGEQTLVPVGMYEKGKSPYGVYDMAGNVWEWVADWYDPTYYQKSPRRNPKGPASGTHRVLRGSGWNVETPMVRIFTRVKSHPLNRDHATGFRCAADAPAH
ncbi:MAG: formylglycine-generating enzyme family protein [Nitrospirae bacterium]|nr:MAG: formylglycine-generating enzyme family protein [Nitrospirota bacterium]